MSLQTDKERGEAAKALLVDDTFTSAFQAVEGAIMARWRGSLAPEDRERLWMAISVLDKVKGWIVGAVRAGEFSAKQIEFDERAKAARKPRSK